MEESAADLELPVSGLPPIPQHLLKTIKQGQYVDLTDLLPGALRDTHFCKAQENKDEAKKKYNLLAAFSSYKAVAVHLKPQQVLSWQHTHPSLLTWQEKAGARHG